MATLTAAQRKKMKASTFAGPGRSYPVPDKSHAANAKARASQQVAAGNLSASAKAKIDAKANKVLGSSKKMATKSHGKRKLPPSLAAHEFKKKGA